ncbi:COP9 signalosome (CSN) subunit [Haplosporangium sp. Z 27]|nr:COP9 signalosome (CSN) subunit [Haplosporangium sp. Z 27]
MKLPMYLGQIKQALHSENDSKLYTYLEVYGKHTERMLSESPEPDYEVERQCKERLEEPWSEAVYHIIIAGRAIYNGDLITAYQRQEMALTTFLRIFQKSTNWPLETLFTLNRDLRKLAVEADQQLIKRGDKPTNLEDCARTINKSFTTCITDRSPLSISKKWGTYGIVCILFRTYFRLKSHNLCKNILRAIKVADLPDLDRFPMAHQVSMRYYTGVLASFDEDFAKAEPDLQFALDHTPHRFHSHRRLILHYLIPARLLRGSLPSAKILEEFPELATLYGPLVKGIKTGNVLMFDEALSQGADQLMAMGTYLTVEVSRGLAIRTLFKKVCTISGGSSRIEVSQFQTALAFVGVTADLDEVECILANMIYKKYIRGYLSQEKRVLVLSKGNPFPALSSIQ